MDETIDTDNSQGSKSSENSGISIAHSEKQVICMTDIVIECIDNGLQHDAIDALGIRTFGAVRKLEEEDIHLLHLERVPQSQSRWEYNGKLERFIGSNGITFFAQASSAQGNILGCIHFTAEDLEGLELPNNKLKISGNMLAEDNRPTLNLSLMMSMDQQVQDNNESLDHLKNVGEIPDTTIPTLYQEKVVHMSTKEHKLIAKQLENLGTTLWNQFQHTANVTDMSQAISMKQRAISLTPEGHADIPFRLSNLASLFWSLFKHTGDLTDIYQAISMLQKAVSITPEGHAEMPLRLSNLAISLWSCFGHTGDLTNLSAAISILQKSLSLTPDGHAEMPLRLSNLAISFWSHFQHTGDLTDIYQAISMLQKAVSLTPDGHTEMPCMLSNLAMSLRSCFEHTGDLTNISQAIFMLQRAISLTPEGHADMPLRLSNLAISWKNHFNHTGDLIDISQAISMLQKAISLTPEGHAEMPLRLSNLASSLRCCFEHTGDLTHISQAILTGQKAVFLTSEGHAEMPRRLSNLASSLQSQFENTGNLLDLSQAISMFQKAVSLTPDGHAAMPLRLSNLASALQSHFEHTGDLLHLSQAISMFQKAVSLTPDSHAEMPRRLSNLASSAWSHFERTGDLTDISQAISMLQKAVSLTSDGHGEMPRRLSNLGSSLQSRFKHTGDHLDLSQAISMLQKAVSLTPDGHTEMPGILSNFACSLESHFKHTGDHLDLSQAISTFQKAVSLTPDGHAEMPHRLSNLASALQSHFEQTRDLTYSSEAISLYQRAISLIPEGHSNLAHLLLYLACALKDHSEHIGDIKILQTAISSCNKAAQLSTSPPSVRLDAAKCWAIWSQKLDPLQSLDAYNIAIELISQIAGMEQTTQRCYKNLVDISGLSLSAATVALSLGFPSKAIEWLEQGRCLVWTQLNNLRSPLDNLYDYNPKLANDLSNVSHQLEIAASRVEHIVGESMAKQMTQQEEANTHLKLSRQRDQLLADIRAIPQFKDFLQPPSCLDLLSDLPKSGKVVVINVHESHCDAIALIHGQAVPLHIPLPDFSYDQANSLCTLLQTYLSDKHLRARGDELKATDHRASFIFRKGEIQNVMSHILKELWNTVVKPILNGLGYLSPPSQLAQIWWCTTGPFSFLPIHAAGIYSTQPSDTASTLSDFAISSYIPTVRSLTEQAKNLNGMQKKKRGLLMISQPNTPGCTPIPGTKTEVEAIQSIMNKHNIQHSCLEEDKATIDQTLINMNIYSCVHFACHASQNQHDPLNSAFFLHDGKLELSTIIKQHLKGADLAFLSACQTSVGDRKLQDEAVHLAAGMLAAGYQGVVATMWSIKDAYAPGIAKNFYAYLMGDEEKEGHKDLDGSNASFALHHAIKEFRRNVKDSESESGLLAWVPYVHFGL